MNRRISSLFIALLLILNANLFAAGMPVFDIESWVYSVMQYYQMIEEVKNTAQSYYQAGQQFEQAYKALASGDLDELMKYTNKALGKMKASTKQLDNLLDHKAETDRIAMGLSEDEIRWDVEGYFAGIYKDAETVYKRTRRTIDDYNTSMQELAQEALEQMQDDQKKTAQLASSQSTAEQQGAQLAEQFKKNTNDEAERLNAQANETSEQLEDKQETIMLQAKTLEIKTGQMHASLQVNQGVSDYLNSIHVDVSL